MGWEDNRTMRDLLQCLAGSWGGVFPLRLVAQGGVSQDTGMNTFMPPPRSTLDRGSRYERCGWVGWIIWISISLLYPG